MANTITTTYLHKGPGDVVLYVALASDGTEETATVIYDSSAVATAIGIADPSDSTIMSIKAYVGSAATARAQLLWDATADVLAHTLIPGQQTEVCYKKVGGLPNQGGDGKTGDILLTTTGLEAGDSITLVLHVKPN
jgi:hypothetical protein